MSAEFTIHEAKTHLSRLLERVAAGERITISRAGRPVADLVPHQRSNVRIGGLSDRIRYDEPTSTIPTPTSSACHHTGPGTPAAGDGTRNTRPRTAPIAR